MSSLVSIAILVFVGACILAILKKLLAGKSSSGQFKYQRSRYLQSKAELSFYGVLKQAVGDAGVVFSKVRVADVLSPAKGQGRSGWQTAFNKISAKHFDFVICDPNGSGIRLAVELDDASHGAAKRVKRDEFLDGACTSAGLPLLRVKAARGYEVADLRDKLTACGMPGLQGEEEMITAPTNYLGSE
jgi:hypothetical protein